VFLLETICQFFDLFRFLLEACKLLMTHQQQQQQQQPLP
jgi:hypothetical protein